MYVQLVLILRITADSLRLLHHLHRQACSGLQGYPRYWQLQPLGPVLAVRFHCMLPSQQVRLICIFIVQEERLRVCHSLRLRKCCRVHLSRHRHYRRHCYQEAGLWRDHPRTRLGFRFRPLRRYPRHGLPKHFGELGCSSFLQHD